MRIGIVGAGNWGRNLVRVFCDLLGEESVIVCDVERKRLQTIGERHPGVALTEDLEALMADRRVEAVAIATPAVTHFELARQALISGRHVLVEKPLAMELAQAEELIALAEREDRRLMVDHLLEYHPAVETLKRLVDEGELGELLYLYSRRLNLGVIRTEENALWSLGPHDISVFLYLLGREPLRVSARGGAYLQREEAIEDVVFLDLEFAGGIRAHTHLSWLDPQKVRQLVLVGSRRMAVFDDAAQAQEKLKLYDYSAARGEGGWQARLASGRTIVLSPEEPLRLMARHFLDSIGRGFMPRSDGRDGLRVLRVLAAAQRSLEEGGRPIEVEG